MIKKMSQEEEKGGKNMAHLEERNRIEIENYLNHGYSIHDIDHFLKVAPSTISREIQRNVNPVCNSCPNINRCKLEKRVYKASAANIKYNDRILTSRLPSSCQFSLFALYFATFSILQCFVALSI